MRQSMGPLTILPTHKIERVMIAPLILGNETAQCGTNDKPKLLLAVYRNPRDAPASFGCRRTDRAISQDGQCELRTLPCSAHGDDPDAFRVTESSTDAYSLCPLATFSTRENIQDS